MTDIPFDENEPTEFFDDGSPSDDEGSTSTLWLGSALGNSPARPENLEEALQFIEALPGWSPEKVRRYRSDVAVAARHIITSLEGHRISGGGTPKDLPCDPTLLRPMLQAVKPGRFFKDKHRWCSIRSSISTVLGAVGWVEPRRAEAAVLPVAWQWAAAHLKHPTSRAMFKNFGRFCVGQGVTPDAVTNDTLVAYHAHRERHTIDLMSSESVSILRRAWNKVPRAIDGWTFERLPTPKRPGSYMIPLTDMHESFLEDIKVLQARLLKPSPFDRIVGRPRSPVFVDSLGHILKRCASILHLSGWSKDEVKSVDALVTPKAVEVILTDQYDRLGKGVAWNAGSVAIASNLKLLLRISSTIPAADAAASMDLCKSVRGPKAGITRKNRDRLAIYDDPAVMENFLRLPERCWKAADQRFKEGNEVSGAQLHQTATALALLMCKPLRRSSLVSLDLKRHFRYDRCGCPISFCIDGSETKSGLDAEAIIHEQLGRRLKLHVEKYRPHLVKRDCDYLFPGKVTGSMNPQSMSNALTKLVVDHVGAGFGVQFARHLIATLVLDADPANGPIAQRLLDHTNLKTTTTYYGMQRTRSAQAAYAKILASKLSTKGGKK